MKNYDKCKKFDEENEEKQTTKGKVLSYKTVDKAIEDNDEDIFDWLSHFSFLFFFLNFNLWSYLLFY